MGTRTVTKLVLAAALAVPGVAAAQVHVGGSVNVHVGGNAQLRPTQPPPAPRVEKWSPRAGQQWVAGRYEWRHGKWEWRNGKYQSRKRGKRWTEGRWELQGDSYVYVDGTWNDAPKEPDAPPALIVETEQSRPGSTWIAGYWKWNDGSYDWVPGHLERRPKGKRWQAGAWNNAGGHWAFTAGTWIDAPRDPGPPPAPRAETPLNRRGQVWVAGFWKLDDGEYIWTPGHLEGRKRMKRYQQGHWDNQGGKWQFAAGTWVDAPKEPDAGPPPPPVEAEQAPRRGYVWVEGNWQYKDGDYEWTAGHFERERAGRAWHESRWENVGGKWSFTAGTWQ